MLQVQGEANHMLASTLLLNTLDINKSIRTILVGSCCSGSVTSFT